MTATGEGPLPQAGGWIISRSGCFFCLKIPPPEASLPWQAFPARHLVQSEVSSSKHSSALAAYIIDGPPPI